MNTIKKMKAISKLLGGCNGLVGTTADQLLIKVGLQSKLEDLDEISRVRAEYNTQNSSASQLVHGYMGNVVKDMQRVINKSIECDRDCLAEDPKFKLPDYSLLNPKNPHN